MGSDQSMAAINEAVYFLSRTASVNLDNLKQQYPQLSEELKEGIYAGPEHIDSPNKRSYLIAKAEIMFVALNAAMAQSKNVKKEIARKIMSSRRNRFFCQAFVLLGSSSALGATALDGKILSAISAAVTLLAALGNLLAEYQEKLLNPQNGNIYEAFQKLGESTYRAQILMDELKLATSHADGEGELQDLIGKANILCGELNTWLIQLVVQYPAQSD